MPGRLPSLSLSSRLGPNISLKSVLRLSRDGGGEDTLDPSCENRLLVGNVSELCKRSPPDSLRRAPGRVEGELFMFRVMDVRRLRTLLFGVPSFVFWVGGFSGELTEEANA